MRALRGHKLGKRGGHADFVDDGGGGRDCSGWQAGGQFGCACGAGRGVVCGGASVAHADTPSSGVDLSQYSLVGRYDLPEPTRTTPPADSLLAQEASSVTYDWDTDTLFVVGDGGTSVVQVSKTGQLIDSMTLAPGDSPQGTTFYDTEAITYVGGGKFVLGEERDRQVNLFTYVAGDVLTRGDVQTVKLGTTIGNIGIEGISYDPQTSTADSPGFVVVKETSPEGIFQTNIDFAAGTATNGSPTHATSRPTCSTRRWPVSRTSPTSSRCRICPTSPARTPVTCWSSARSRARSSTSTAPGTSRAR